MIRGRWADPSGSEFPALLEMMHDGLAQDVRFQVESPASRSRGEVGQLERGGDEGDIKMILIERGDRQAHAIDADRPFGGQKLRHRFGGEDRESYFGFIGDLMNQLAGAIDVALDEMAVEPITDPQRSFDIDLVADFERAEVGLVECLPDDVVSEPAGDDLGDGEADAVVGDAFAELDIVPMRGDDQTAEHRAVVDLKDWCGALDDSRKHDSDSDNNMAARNLKDMVVVITGASAGIGKALAEELSPAGAKLVLAARRTDTLEEVNRSLGGHHLCVRADVSQLEDCHSLIEQTIARHGRIDTLVCNAGFGIYKWVKETTPDDTRSMFATNVLGSTDCIYYALPQMLKQDRRDGFCGQVMLVSSAAGRRGFPCIGMYSATKAAQFGLAEAMRVELKPSGIAVTSVHPIHTGTEFGKVAESKGQLKMVSGPMGQDVSHVARRMRKAIERPCPEVWPARMAGWMLGLGTLMPRLMDRAVGMYRKQVEKANS